MEAEIFIDRIEVTATAIDERQHVNNLAYLEWCLQAAEKHWQRNAPKEIKERYVWYVLRHEIDYRASAFEEDDLEIATWVSLAEGVKSERRYKIKRVSDDQLLIEAKTLWCLLDGNTLKPARIPEEIRILFLK